MNVEVTASDLNSHGICLEYGDSKAVRLDVCRNCCILDFLEYREIKSGKKGGKSRKAWKGVRTYPPNLRDALEYVERKLLQEDIDASEDIREFLKKGRTEKILQTMLTRLETALGD
jgi:hypothetical protein